MPGRVTIIPFPKPVKKERIAKSINRWLCEAIISEAETIIAPDIISCLTLNFLIKCVITNALIIIPEKKIRGRIPASPSLI